MKKLSNKIALVSGATRGAGRGIACALGEAGATVYCTGRSSNEHPGKRPETIEETAELVTQHGGKGISIRVDHQVESEVEALITRIEKESGRLDLLVNDLAPKKRTLN
jgi:NAD(P)-dependent dehydrogenase (short-subunit alcohol dehydrogenase family)